MNDKDSRLTDAPGFENGVIQFANFSADSFGVPVKPTDINAEYERSRAVRRQSERRGRRTKLKAIFVWKKICRKYKPPF